MLRSLSEDLCSFSQRIRDSLPSTPRILTPFNYLDWRENIHLALHKLRYYSIILGREVEPHQLVEKNKFLNQLDEAFSYICTHISIDHLFQLKGLRIPRESWENIEDLFGKQDEI